MQCQLSNRAHRFDRFANKTQSVSCQPELAQALTSLFWSIKHKKTPENSLYVPNKPREAEEGQTAPPGHTLTLHALRNVATISPAVHPPWKNSSGISAMVSLLRESVRGADLCLHESHACWCCVRSCLVVFSVHIQHAMRLEHCKMHQLQAFASAVFCCPAGQLAQREWCMVCESVWCW